MVVVVVASVSVQVQAYLPLNSQAGKQSNFVSLYINMYCNSQVLLIQLVVFVFKGSIVYYVTRL